MGRTKKADAAEEVISAQEVTNEIVAKEEVVEAPKPVAKVQRISITASYKTKTVS